MIVAIFIAYSALITIAAGGAVMLVHRAYIHQIDGLRSELKDVLDRLFQKNALPPSGVDLTEKYEARQERINAGLGDRPMKPKPLGPIETLEATWTQKDRQLVERRNVDATRGRLN